MKKISLMIIILFAICLAASSFADDKTSKASRVIENLKFPELKWDVPEIGKDVTRTVLPNGMIVYMKEDHELPTISAHVMVRTGSIYDSRQDMAVAGITGTVMRTGGTKSFSPDSLNTLLEFIAGSVETGIGTEAGSASMSVMSKDLDLGLKNPK